MREDTTAGAGVADEGSLMWPARATSAGEETRGVKGDLEPPEVQMRERSRQLLLLVVQLLCVAAVGGYCLYTSKMDPVSIGFFCDDDSIRYPLLPQTVPALDATLICLLCPVGIMLLVDWVATREFGDRFVCGGPIDLVCFRLPPLWRLYYKSIGSFIFAMLCTAAITQTGKICVGRLRPHFIAVCAPDWPKIRCKDETGFLYIDHYECTSGDLKKIRNGRMSFPSGHSSTAMCAMVYLVLYLQSRLVRLNQAAAAQKNLRSSVSSTSITRALWRVLRGLGPFLQLLAFAVAFFIGISRIKDRYHHPTDVVAGFCVGFLVALYAAFYIARFGSWKEITEYDTSDEKALDHAV